MMMTCSPLVSYSIDKLELSLRFGEDNYFPIDLIGDLVNVLIESGDYQIYRNPCSYGEGSRGTRCLIKMRTFPCASIFVEFGVRKNRYGRFTYAKFSYNPTSISQNERARAFFKDVIDGLLPSGYQQLLDEAHVLYAEFAIDFKNYDINPFDLYSPQLTKGRMHYGSDGMVETCSIFPTTPHRELEFTAYDKKLQLWKKQGRLIRGRKLRVEAKCRFQLPEQ